MQNFPIIGQPSVRETRYYDVLGVHPHADATEIKKAYKRLAKQLHPDKNPNNVQVTEKFKELSFIFSVLEDPEKRKVYDECGESGVRDGGDINARRAGVDDYASSMFNHLFGSAELYGAPNMGNRKGRDVHHAHKVTLEDLYMGKTSKLALQKSVICPGCKGFGGREGAVHRCLACEGRGVVFRLRQVAPHMAQQASSKCDVCDGEGEVFADRCKICNGRRTVSERKILEVHIDKGMRNGQKIVFRNEGDQQPGITPGDVVIVVEETPHEVLKREGMDLVTEMDIELSEALCGFKRVFTHLDGRQLLVTSSPGAVVHEGMVRCIYGEGMPLYRHPGEKGRLLIRFHINFPRDHFTSPEGLTLLAQLLPPPRPVPVNCENMEEVELSSTETNGQNGYAKTRPQEAPQFVPDPNQCRSQ